MRDELDHLEQLNQLTEADERALQIANLRYALATHIPAMKRHVHIHTGYGSLEFHGPQARKITALCEELLQKQLQRLERKGGPRR
jgi:hypothetical protein